MLSNYFKLAYRNLLSNKMVFLINIFGLSIAVGCCITVFLFLKNNWTMDDFHENGERIFIVEYAVDNDGQEQIWGSSPMPLGPALTDEFPQIERAVRTELMGGKVYLDDRVFNELVYFADPGFFDMFTFPLKMGDPQVLNEPNAVILSANFAEKYFNDENPMGKNIIVVIDNQHKRIFTVKGVAEKFPENIGFGFDILTGFNTLASIRPDAQTDWTQPARGTFVQLRQPEDVQVLAKNMGKFVSLHNAVNDDVQIQSFVFDNLRHPNDEAYQVYRRPFEASHPLLTVMFSLIALLMMALSCFNYINISLGLAGKRLKEIGVRKVMGGKKIQLIAQFMSENLLLCLLALIAGLALTEGVFAPMLNARMVTKISLSFVDDPWLWYFLTGLLALTGVASGAYPAFYLSSLQPVSIFRGQSLFKRKSLLTRIFLTIQFVLAFCTVIIGVVLVFASDYWENLPWGYRPEQTLVVRLDQPENYPFLKTEAERNPYVLRTAGAMNQIGESLNRDNVFFDETKFEVVRFDVSAGYFETMGLRLSSGRFFDEDRQFEDADAVVINQTFAEARDWTAPLGQQFRADDKTYTVIGVVDDFKILGSAATRPVVFYSADAAKLAYLVIRYESGAGTRVEQFMKSAWQGLYPEIPFSYFHQKLVFENFYENFDRAASSFRYIAGLALVIACLGLFGLASQNYASHLKEVSIRKVLGASVKDIVFLSNRMFLFILAIASIVATTVCFSGIQLLLSEVKEFTGTMELGIAPYILANALVFLTAFIAISSQTYKLARISPATTLRDE